jgi:hypothetical protein
MIKTKKFNIKWKNKCKYTSYTSISLWNDLILANKINSNTVEVFDSETGKYIKDILNEDMGIFEIKNADDNLIINDLLFRIDRFLGICQVYNLAMNKPIGIFGFKNLKLPQCITGYFKGNKYLIYILDDNNNNIIRYELQIVDNNIIDIKHYNFMNLPIINSSHILIDDDYERILLNDINQSVLIILDFDGNILKKINVEISDIIIHNNSYIYTDNENDTNMLHLIDRDTMKYKISYNSISIKNITYMTSTNNKIYILDNDCTLAELSLDDEDNNNNNNLLLVTLGVLVSALFLK